MINFFFSSSYTDMNIHEDTSTEDENNMEKKRKKMKFEAKVGIPLRSVEITVELKKKKIIWLR